MGVIGYLMGVPIKYPKRRKPQADILGGGGAAEPPHKI
jgi:hypothetical protein